MKKAQIQEMPIIYIFALIVAALILVFGLNYVFNLQKTGEQIELGRFKQDIEREVAFMYNLDTGSSSEVKLRTPSKINTICFTNPEQKVTSSNKQLNDLLFLNPTHNFFILADDPSQDKSFNVEHLKSDINPFCTEIKGEFKVIFENKGKYVSPKR
ncbi:hypothetical protein J4414_00740 [Candidatus Woesearchaeota archaeon]|nr:hypothetical protein [Candidatus Woesearchaeota archaeon]